VPYLIGGFELGIVWEVGIPLVFTTLLDFGARPELGPRKLLKIGLDRFLYGDAPLPKTEESIVNLDSFTGGSMFDVCPGLAMFCCCGCGSFDGFPFGVTRESS
jgi:hypothetical protein